jgi:hypothetical protein
LIKSFGHKFHIPVLGVAYSVDAPLKVAQYGISSVMSLVDDTLVERLRQHYLEKFGRPYIKIEDSDDARSLRITAYLNMVKQLVEEQFEELRNSPFEIGSEITKYFDMLPDSSELKIKYYEMLNSEEEQVQTNLQNELRKNIFPGSIDVNIMTKVDKANYNSEGDQLP